MKPFIRTLTLLLVVATSLSANGQKEVAPTIPFATRPVQFVAPAVEAAAFKTLAVPFAPVADTKQVIRSWSFTVYDAAGQVVLVQSQSATTDRGFFKELLNIGPRVAVELPPQLVWNGTDSAGKPVANGVYTWIVSVTDSRGATVQSNPATVTIQNSPLFISRLTADYTIFSPRGTRKAITIRQAGSREVQWQGAFKNAAGEIVREYDWNNFSASAEADQAPADFEWDGRNGAGEILPDGEYRYTLTGLSRTGVTVSKTLDQPLVISEKPGVLRLTSAQTVFSPKADKASSLTIKADSGNAEGLVDWSLTVSDPAKPKVAVWSRSGKAPLPETLLFEGKDLLGRDLLDGSYQAVLTANFANGNAGVSPALAFEIDTKPAGAKFQTPFTVYGGPARPTLKVEIFGDTALWLVELLGPDGQPVGNGISGPGGQMGLEILGTDVAGKARPDGRYLVRATSLDAAGNKGVYELAVTKDTRSMGVTLNASGTTLAPQSAASASLTVTPSLEVTDSVVQNQWSLASVDAAGNPLKTVEQKALAPGAVYVWKGLDGEGKPLPDGAYRLSLAVSYTNGTVTTAAQDLTINSEFYKQPQGAFTTPYTLFGGVDRAVVPVKFQGDSDVAWTIELLDPVGKSYATNVSAKGAAAFELSSAKAAGLPDGALTLRATAESVAGVKGVVTLALRKDTRTLGATLDLSRKVLVPGKGSNATVRVLPLLDVTDSVLTTLLEVRSAAGVVLASQTRSAQIPFWDWDGKDTSGRLAADGPYVVALKVSYANGGVASATAALEVNSTWLAEPQGTLTVSQAVFGSAQRPSVTASFVGDAGLDWNLEVLDKAGKVAKSSPLGSTGSASVEIGTDAAGKPLADGTYTLRASARSKADLPGLATTTVRKDSRSMGVSLDLSSTTVVPGNALNGSVKLTPVLEVLDSIETTTLTLSGPDGAAFEKRTSEGLVTFWDWDGTDTSGKLLPDGTYQFGLTVAYTNGAQSSAKNTVKLDSTYLKEPQGVLTASGTVFGGSGRAGVTVNFAGDAGLPWTLEVLGADGKTVAKAPLGDTGQKSLTTQELTKDLTLADGPYTLRASAVSRAGVSGTALLQLRKDSRQAKVSLDLSRSVIVPGKGANGTVRITPLLEAVDSVEKTVITVLGPDGKAVGERSGTGPVPFWDWGGVSTAGKNLANGTYEVALTVSYANGSVSRASAQIKIDSTYLNDQGPLVTMTLSSRTFAPNNVDGATELLVAIATTEGVVPVDNWQLAAVDSRGKVFRQWSGKGLPPKLVTWDGKAENGDTVESGEDYQLQLKVADTQNHVTRKTETVTIDIAVVKIAEGKYKIVVSSIQFPGNSSDLFKLPGELLDKNLYVLKRLANALGKFPGYKIRLEGYAVSEFWNDPKASVVEQKTQLLPLSLDRANSVRSVMVLLGIEPERFNVLGFGGDKPIVPHGDLENRWKNRRVEFYLDKN